MPGFHMSRTRTRRFKLLAIVAGCLFAGLCGEVLVRIFFKRLHDTTLLSGQLDTTNIKGLIDADDDPQIMYGLRRSMSTSFCGTRVETDAGGARINPGTSAEDGDAARIALIGDSSSFGWRVDYPDTYGERARGFLEAALGRKVVLRNYSVPGYNAVQEARVFEAKVTAFRPHLLVVHHDANDSQPLGWGYDMWIPPEYGDNFLHSALVKSILRQLKKIGMRKTPSEDPANEFLGGYCIAGPLYDSMLQHRQRLYDAAAAIGVPAIVILFHSGLDATSDPESDPNYIHLHKKPKALFSAMGYRVLDMYPLLQKLMADKKLGDLKSFWCAPDDGHPDPAFHEFIGRALSDLVTGDPGLRAALSK